MADRWHTTTAAREPHLHSSQTNPQGLVLVQNAVLTARHAVLGTLAGFAGALGLPLVADSEAYAAAANQRGVASTRCACGCLHRHQHAGG